MMLRHIGPPMLPTPMKPTFMSRFPLVLPGCPAPWTAWRNLPNMSAGREPWVRRDQEAVHVEAGHSERFCRGLPGGACPLHGEAGVSALVRLRRAAVLRPRGAR